MSLLAGGIGRMILAMRNTFQLVLCAFGLALFAGGHTDAAQRTAPTAPTAPIDSVDAQPGDYVVVVHGLTWLKDTMKPTVQRLEREGYRAVSFRYPSRESMNVDELVAALADTVTKECTDRTKRVHFVGHSMGTVLLRCYLAKHRPSHLGRVIFMAAPNQGTELADLISRSKTLQVIFGRSAPALGRGKDCLPCKLPAADYSPGIIMGNRTGYFMLSAMLPGEDDGIIPVASGRLSGMGDFIVVPTTHSYMPAAESALTQVSQYLRHGAFDHAAQADSDLRSYPLWKTGSRAADLPARTGQGGRSPLLPRLLRGLGRN